MKLLHNGLKTYGIISLPIHLSTQRRSIQLNTRIEGRTPVYLREHVGSWRSKVLSVCSCQIGSNIILGVY